jgi:uncharacterized protein (DUF488 family)
VIFTVGYEGRTVRQLVLRLREAGVERVLDVRRSARSPRPGYSKGALAKAFAAAGLEYAHLPEVGNPFFAGAASDLEGVLARYRAHLAAGPALVDMALAAAAGARTALLCSEANPRRCHRGVLAEVLQERGERVVHL